MSDQSAGSTLVEIAAARALQWNLEFDRGLRSAKPGAQCEAVMKLGPQLVRLSYDCVVNASSANLFKLEPGQDRMFANAILLRLADTFRSGNNFVRVCVLKALMLEFKGRGWIGERFAGDNSEKSFVSKNLTHKGGSRARRKFRSGDEGLLTKKRIENHAEMLKRVKSVIVSGDPTSRALAIRVLGCLADLSKDSVDVRNIVLQAVHSPHRQEVTAALFAMGCLSELSDEFAAHSLQKSFEIINAMETPPQVKVLAVRLFARVGNSSVLSLQAFEMGRRIMLRYPLHEIVTTMLVSLTMLAAGSSVIMGNQVNLLLTYIGGDPRMNVRAVALKCLSKLVPQAFCSIEASDNIFNEVFAVVQDMTVPSTLHVLALRVIQKLFHQCVATMEIAHLLQIISWVELAALCGVWPAIAQALSLLVDGVRDIKKFKLQSVPSEYRTELMQLSTRICFLLCDQVSVTGLVARRSGEMRQSGTVSVTEVDTIGVTKRKVSTLCVLLLKLVQAYPPVGWQVVDSLAGVIEAVARGNLDQRKGSGDTEDSKRIIDQETRLGDKYDSATLVTECMNAKGSTYVEIEVVMTDIGRCLSACASLPEYKPNIIEDIHRRLLQLVRVLISVDTPYSALIPTLQALMKAALALDSLKILGISVGKGPEIGKLDDGKSCGRQRHLTLVAQSSRSTFQKLGTEFMQRCNFRICYELGKQGALSALWDLAHFTFDGLVDKISSEGCYFWLKALSYQSKAEAVLQIGKDVEERANESLDTSGNTDLPRDIKLRRDVENFKEKSISKLSNTKEGVQVEETNLERFGKAAAHAVPLLQNSISSLSAGACLERMFEFQRWMLTLRLEVLECVSELVGVLARISSLDTDAGVIDLEDESKNNDMKSLGSALMASTEQIQLLASRLKKLSEEYDLLPISFMGVDERSVGMLSRAALFCSLLTFCSAGLLSAQPSNSQLPVNVSINVGAVALDLFRRLEQTESGDWDDLLTFAIQSGADGISGQGFGGTSATGPLENALVNLSRWAVKSVLSLQKQHTLLGVVRGARLLQEILEECLYLPWPSPPFFFCTRPRTGVELFVAQAGANTGETEDLSVTQGSALSLSVCLQIIHAPLESLVYLKRLVCRLSIQSAESTLKLVDEVHPVSKSGFIVNQPIHPAVLEQLIMHSKMPMGPNASSRWGMGPSLGQAVTHKTKDPAPDLIFCVSLDSKGQGFASCTLDVSQIPCGEYQLILSCICVDGKSGEWILPLLSARPGFRII
ncbi:unnamed protein product [Calypogeia fissa]